MGKSSIVKEKMNGKVKYYFDGVGSLQIRYRGRLVDASPLNENEIAVMKTLKHRGVVNRSTACKILGQDYCEIIEKALLLS